MAADHSNDGTNSIFKAMRENTDGAQDSVKGKKVKTKPANWIRVENTHEPIVSYEFKNLYCITDNYNSFTNSTDSFLRSCWHGYMVYTFYGVYVFCCSG